MGTSNIVNTIHTLIFYYYYLFFTITIILYIVIIYPKFLYIIKTREIGEKDRRNVHFTVFIYNLYFLPELYNNV